MHESGDGTVAKLVAEMDRLSGPPGIGTMAALEATLDRMFAETQAAAHVITGSLRASGKKHLDVRGHVWRAEISYGGSSSGAPNDPVDYAIYEMNRGGAHDFLAGLALHDRTFESVIDRHFAG